MWVLKNRVTYLTLLTRPDTCWITRNRQSSNSTYQAFHSKSPRHFPLSTAGWKVLLMRQWPCSVVSYPVDLQSTLTSSSYLLRLFRLTWRCVLVLAQILPQLIRIFHFVTIRDLESIVNSSTPWTCQTPTQVLICFHEYIHVLYQPYRQQYQLAILAQGESFPSGTSGLLLFGISPNCRRLCLPLANLSLM